MPPGPLLEVVVDGQLRLTARTAPQPPLMVGHEHLHLALLDRQLHVVDEPGVLEPEQAGIELNIAHVTTSSLSARLRAPGGQERHLSVAPLLRAPPRTAARRPGTDESPSENRSAAEAHSVPWTPGEAVARPCPNRSSLSYVASANWDVVSSAGAESTNSCSVYSPTEKSEQPKVPPSAGQPLSHKRVVR
jgi:hypothetical protein